MDTRGLYLNRWTPDFAPEMDVPNAVPAWVRLPHLPLHCWGDESVKVIGNAVGKYIYRSEPRENMHACARICVEVDLGKGLLEAVKIKVDNWVHIQHLTTNKYHSNARYATNTNILLIDALKQENEETETQEPKWEQVKKKKTTNK